MRDVILITGPPCSGKTTHAHRIADGHEIVDFDAIARELGSPAQHQHAARWIAPAEAETQARIDRIAADPNARAIVIRSAPKAQDRDTIARHLDANQVLLLNPGEKTCRARAAARPSGTRRAVGLWYWHYTRRTADSEVLTAASARVFD